MIMIFMMHGQLLQVGAGKFPATAAAYPGIHLQRLLTVSMTTYFAITPGFGDDAIQLLF